MNADATAARAPEAALERRAHPTVRALRRFLRHPVNVLALALLLVILVAGLLGRHIAPYEFTELHLGTGEGGPRLEGWHFFGTDVLGRDTLSRTLVGLHTTLQLCLAVTGIATVVGLIVGGIAAQAGGSVDFVLMRIVDAVLTIPVLAALFTALVLIQQVSPYNIGKVLALYMWAYMARVVRGGLLVVGSSQYVEAAHAAGAGPARIILRHLLPNAAGPVLTAATFLFAQVVLLDTTAEFFGFGANQDVLPTLGNLVADGTAASGFSHGGFLGEWWLWAFPAIVIVLLIVCVNFVADGIDEALNPTRR